jgi:hypothetical protein
LPSRSVNHLDIHLISKRATRWSWYPPNELPRPGRFSSRKIGRGRSNKEENASCQTHTHTQKKSRTYYTNACLNNCIIRPYCRHKCVPCYLIIWRALTVKSNRNIKATIRYAGRADLFLSPRPPLYVSLAVYRVHYGRVYTSGGAAVNGRAKKRESTPFSWPNSGLLVYIRIYLLLLLCLAAINVCWLLSSRLANAAQVVKSSRRLGQSGTVI